jgi:hypothetical protein
MRILITPSSFDELSLHPDQDIVTFYTNLEVLEAQVFVILAGTTMQVEIIAMPGTGDRGARKLPVADRSTVVGACGWYGDHAILKTEHHEVLSIYSHLQALAVS